MKVLILEERGIYKAGDKVEMAMAQGQQWINSGFAEYVPEAPKPKAKPKAKAKAEPKEEPKVKKEAKKEND